jgi:hypothetical protein
VTLQETLDPPPEIEAGRQQRPAVPFFLVHDPLDLLVGLLSASWNWRPWYSGTRLSAPPWASSSGWPMRAACFSGDVAANCAASLTGSPTSVGMP